MRWILLLSMSWWLAAGDLRAAPAPVALKWAEVGPMIQGNRVELDLTDGGKISGEVVAVRESSIVISAKNSSRRGSGAGSGSEVDRKSIRLIRLQKTPGRWGRKLGAGVGLLAGLSVGSYAAFHAIDHSDSGAAGLIVFTAVASASTVAGYFIGKRLDGRTILIQVIP